MTTRHKHRVLKHDCGTVVAARLTASTPPLSNSRYPILTATGAVFAVLAKLRRRSMTLLRRREHRLLRLSVSEDRAAKGNQLFEGALFSWAAAIKSSAVNSSRFIRRIALMHQTLPPEVVPIATTFVYGLFERIAARITTAYQAISIPTAKALRWRRRRAIVNAGDTLQRKRPAAPAVATIGLVTTTSFTGGASRA